MGMGCGIGAAAQPRASDTYDRSHDSVHATVYEFDSILLQFHSWLAPSRACFFILFQCHDSCLASAYASASILLHLRHQALCRDSRHAPVCAICNSGLRFDEGLPRRGTIVLVQQ